MLRSSAAGLSLSAVHPVSGIKADSRLLPVSAGLRERRTTGYTDANVCGSGNSVPAIVLRLQAIAADGLLLAWQLFS